MNISPMNNYNPLFQDMNWSLDLTIVTDNARTHIRSLSKQDEYTDDSSICLEDALATDSPRTVIATKSQLFSMFASCGDDSENEEEEEEDFFLFQQEENSRSTPMPPKTRSPSISNRSLGSFLESPIRPTRSLSAFLESPAGCYNRTSLSRSYTENASPTPNRSSSLCLHSPIRCLEKSMAALNASFLESPLLGPTMGIDATGLGSLPRPLLSI